MNAQLVNRYLAHRDVRIALGRPGTTRLCVTLTAGGRPVHVIYNVCSGLRCGVCEDLEQDINTTSLPIEVQWIGRLKPTAPAPAHLFPEQAGR